MMFPAYVSWKGKTCHLAYRVFCGLLLAFLALPVLVNIPLSFNSEPYFSYPLSGFSLKWYQELLNEPQWLLALKNTLIVGVASTSIATVLGVTAALGLAERDLPMRHIVKAIFISPMVVPVVTAGVGMYFLYSKFDLTGNLLGLIIAHAALGTPFVVMTVEATLVGYNASLTRAARSLGASPLYAFFKVKLPLIAPGVISGAVFAFGTSFDEVVVVLFLGGVEQRTVPRQMWSGIREQLSPTILAAATVLTVLSVLLLVVLEILRRRGEQMRGAVSH
ncbi:MAG TPA: ABC transporter permease [Rhodoferax sp.]|nr:ABC transporter permease [Rhodoferax sp.]HOS86346.1 ABC transporter permease [Burkholderiaceae bacterium]